MEKIFCFSSYSFWKKKIQTILKPECLGFVHINRNTNKKEKEHRDHYWSSLHKRSCFLWYWLLEVVKTPPPKKKNTHIFNKETNNSLCVSWSCKELLKKKLKEKSILPECNTFQGRLICSLGFRHMHLSLRVQRLQLKASLNDGALHH